MNGPNGSFSISVANSFNAAECARQEQVLCEQSCNILSDLPTSSPTGEVLGEVRSDLTVLFASLFVLASVSCASLVFLMVKEVRKVKHLEAKINLTRDLLQRNVNPVVEDEIIPSI